MPTLVAVTPLRRTTPCRPTRRPQPDETAHANGTATPTNATSKRRPAIRPARPYPSPFPPAPTAAHAELGHAITVRWSATTQPRSDGPMITPTTISPTTAGTARARTPRLPASPPAGSTPESASTADRTGRRRAPIPHTRSSRSKTTSPRARGSTAEHAVRPGRTQAQHEATLRHHHTAILVPVRVLAWRRPVVLDEPSTVGSSGRRQPATPRRRLDDDVGPEVSCETCNETRLSRRCWRSWRVVGDGDPHDAVAPPRST